MRSSRPRVGVALALALLAVGAVAGEARALTCPPGTTAGSGGCTIGVGSLPGIPLPGRQPEAQPMTSPSPSPGEEPPGEVAGIGLEQVQWWVLSSAGHELQQLKPVVTQPTLAPGDWFRPLYGRMTAIAVWLLGRGDPSWSGGGGFRPWRRPWLARPGWSASPCS